MVCAYTLGLNATSWVGSAPTGGGKYYLYNVGAQKFLARGGSWGSRAIQDEVGLEVTLAVAGEGIYTISTASGYLKVDQSVYVDGNDASQKNWTIESAGTTGYYIKNNGQYLTYDGSCYFEPSNNTNSQNSLWLFITENERSQKLANKEASAPNPLDISYLIPNNSTVSRDNRNPFSLTIQSSDWGVAGTIYDSVGELYTSVSGETWDKSLILSNLPEGNYRFYVTGFYRDGTNLDAYTRYINGTFDDRAKIYASTHYGEQSQSLQSIGTGAGSTLGGNEGNSGDIRYPNDVTAACLYFFNGRYQEQYVDAVVGGDGKLTLGIRVDGTIANNWVCIDKFRLEYLGTDIQTTDVTYLIQNNTFDDWTYWNGTDNTYINAKTENIAEVFAVDDYNIYQDITLNAGVYKLEMQGFFRHSRNYIEVVKNPDNEEDKLFTYRVADAARNVRVKGLENLSSYLYASVGGNERSTALLSIFEEGFDHEPVYDNQQDGGALWHASILPTVPGGVTTAHEVFVDGYYNDNVVIINVPYNTTVRLGIKKDPSAPYTDREWTAFDNMKLYRLDCSLDVALEHEWHYKQIEAQTAMNNPIYANIPTFSQEYIDLQSTITTNPADTEDYYTKLTTLRRQLNAFKASKYWYDRFKGVYDAAKAIGVDASVTNPYDGTTGRITMSGAEAAIQAMVTAIDNKVVTTGNDATYGDITSSFLKGWTVQQFANVANTTQHWDGSSSFYNVNSMDSTRVMEQNMILPPGSYVLKVAGRASSIDRVHELTVNLDDQTVHLPTAGNTTAGINSSDGKAQYTDANQGWEWRFLTINVTGTEAKTIPLSIVFEHETDASMWASVADIQLLADEATLRNLLEFYAEKMRKKIVEVDAAYYGSGPNHQFEEHVDDLFKTMDEVDYYDERDEYTYNSETITASAASTSIGLVNFYNMMHGATLSPDLYRKAYQVMQTKIDMADANAVTYVYARRALIRAKQFEQSRGDVYTVSDDDMTAFNTTLTTLDDELKKAILKVRGLNTGTTETPALNTPENIANSWDDNTNWIRDDYKTSSTYQKCLDDIRAATREFISKITVTEGKQLEITDVFLFNPSFDFNNPYGWTDNGSTRPHNCNTNTYREYLINGAAVETTYVNHYAEYYQDSGLDGAIKGTYNSFQTITGLPYGAYKLTATGSYRRSGISNSPQQRANGDETISAELYASGTHMATYTETYTTTEVVMENDVVVVDEEGNPVTQEVERTREVKVLVTDTDRSMPLYSIYTRAEETAATEGIGADEKRLNTVYGAVPIDFNNYMPVVEHYEGNTVMFSVTRNDGEEDITVGIRDKGYNYQAWTVVDDFRLFYISNQIVNELSEEWTNRVNEAKNYYDAHPSPKESVYGVALATYLNSYDPTTIPDTDLELGEGVTLTDIEKNELKYNLALRRLHIALNDYEAATYWFDELARANKVAESFPYVSGALSEKYDAKNTVTATAVTSTMTMVDAREAAHSVRAQADQISAYYDRSDEAGTIMDNASTAVSLGSLGTWTVATGSNGISQSSNQTFKDGVNYYEPNECFDQTNWTFNISKTVTLAKGVYILKMAARRSGGVNKCDIKVEGDYVGTLTPVTTGTYSNYYGLDDNDDVFTADTVTLDVPRTYSDESYSGDQGYGIATDGSTNYVSGNNKGWQWEYVPFAVSKAGAVTFRIDAESNSLHTWASFAEPQLLQGPVPLYIDGEPAANAASETKTWDLEPCYANVTAKRSIAANGNWNTLVLPFETEVKENWDVQYLVDQDQRTPQDHVTVYFQREKGDNSGKIIAGKPYIIMNNTGEAITEIAEDRVDVIGTTTKVETNDVEMYGTLTHHDVEADGWHFYIAQNNFYRVADANKESGQPVPMKPLRAYFRMKHETASTQARLNFITNFGGDASSVDGIINDSDGLIDGPVYDLQGQLLAPSLSKAHLRPGVYVVNGRKRIVK